MKFKLNHPTFFAATQEISKHRMMTIKDYVESRITEKFGIHRDRRFEKEIFENLRELVLESVEDFSNDNSETVEQLGSFHIVDVILKKIFISEDMRNAMLDGKSPVSNRYKVLSDESVMWISF